MNGMNGMNGLGGLMGKKLSYFSGMSKEMSILAFARGSFKTLFQNIKKPSCYHYAHKMIFLRKKCVTDNFGVKCVSDFTHFLSSINIYYLRQKIIEKTHDLYL